MKKITELFWKFISMAIGVRLMTSILLMLFAIATFWDACVDKVTWLKVKVRRELIFLIYGYGGDALEWVKKIPAAVKASLQAFFDPGYAYDELNSSVLFYPQPM